MREWADLLAEAGRHVVVPDLLGGRTASTIAEADALVAELDMAGVRVLVRGWAEDLAARAVPWAVVGFSLGALLGSELAGRGAAGPEQMDLFYGGGDPGSDVSQTRRVRLHVVPDDPYFTALEIASTESSLRAAQISVQTFAYPQSRHWFAERGTPGFDQKAFTVARTRVVAGLRA